MCMGERLGMRLTMPLSIHGGVLVVCVPSILHVSHTWILVSNPGRLKGWGVWEPRKVEGLKGLGTQEG